MMLPFVYVKSKLASFFKIDFGDFLKVYKRYTDKKFNQQKQVTIEILSLYPIKIARKRDKRLMHALTIEPWL